MAEFVGCQSIFGLSTPCLLPRFDLSAREVGAGQGDPMPRNPRLHAKKKSWRLAGQELHDDYECNLHSFELVHWRLTSQCKKKRESMTSLMLFMPSLCGCLCLVIARRTVTALCDRELGRPLRRFSRCLRQPEGAFAGRGTDSHLVGHATLHEGKC